MDHLWITTWFASLEELWFIYLYFQSYHKRRVASHFSVVHDWTRLRHVSYLNGFCIHWFERSDRTCMILYMISGLRCEGYIVTTKTHTITILSSRISHKKLQFNWLHQCKYLTFMIRNTYFEVDRHIWNQTNPLTFKDSHVQISMCTLLTCNCRFLHSDVTPTTERSESRAYTWKWYELSVSLALIRR